MGFKFRKSFKVAPGVKVNLSNKGVGMSAGVKGVRVSTGPSGSRITTSIPGTGLSYEQRIGKSKKAKQREVSKQNTSYSTMNEPGYNTTERFEPIIETQTYLVTTFRTKDNQANSFARKLMKPLSIITGVCSALFLIMMLVIPALILAAISFLCYKNIKIPFAAVCPGCNAENLLIYKEKKITCRKCKSTLIVQK
ncbi:DUF4236 domain-containing protein [Bacillus cereus]|uniref:DUF4236 domain-containing protein n=1 Tax=Bacillus cereus TaxID=1396 RepID=UPI00227C5782|nr:DUF4236 domain-containing protein [Bacillus cereus]WAI17457.1 DUF4236 domain-containing protein [Bacillus cereus]